VEQDLHQALWAVMVETQHQELLLVIQLVATEPVATVVLAETLTTATVALVLALLQRKALDLVLLKLWEETQVPCLVPWLVTQLPVTDTVAKWPLELRLVAMAETAALQQQVLVVLVLLEAHGLPMLVMMLS
jgi:hypothetical protein